MLVNAIIRPPRAEYEIEELGPVDFDFCNKHFHRTDFEFRNKRGYKIVASHWEPIDSERVDDTLPWYLIYYYYY